ncbi:MAG: M20/M25/M40 family metallo-hydrolase [Gemmatimonadota bacterium]|nr:M20/M25/M40 family metallo-hydrolase [Gemmatimonadota bacterium]
MGGFDPATLELDVAAAAERLGAAIRIPTVSRGGEPPSGEVLDTLHGLLRASFPRVHDALEIERPAGHSLLMTWRAEGAGAEEAPLLLLAHQDVVPVEPGTAGEWSHPPFEGEVADGYVWGRGALDDKARLLGILEAVEALLAAGAEPSRPVLLAFGHDEEVGGVEGARSLAELLDARGVRPFLVLDEGSAVLDGLVPGVAPPVAAVGLGEKGYLSVELHARGEQGHAAMPPAETAAVVLARAIDRLAARPMEARVDGPARGMLEALADEMRAAARIAVAGLPVTEPLLRRRLEENPRTAALIRSTVAPTMLEGSGKENVLPASARAVVNVRIHPRDSVDGVLDHVRRAISDSRVEVRPWGGFRSEPGALSPDRGPAWDRLAGAIRSAFPEAVLAPTLVVVATDARHYERLGAPVYRFAPVVYRPEDLSRVHGTDERVGLEAYERLVRFYAALMAGPGPGALTSER